jgi:hypothetical protein
MEDEDFIIFQGVGHRVDRPVSPCRTGGQQAEQHAKEKPNHIARHDFPPLAVKSDLPIFP